MSSSASINVLLTRQQLLLVKARVQSGDYESESEVVSEGLRLLLEPESMPKVSQARQLRRQLTAGYKSSAKSDRNLVAEWSNLNDPWPDK